MNLKNLYNVAYNFQEPFNTETKNAGSFLFASILFDLKHLERDDDSISFIDLYCWFLNKSGLTLDDVEYAFEKYIGQFNRNFDETLYYNFSENSVFEKFNKAKDLIPDFVAKNSVLNFDNVHNINEDFSTYDRLLLSFGSESLLLCVLDKAYNKKHIDIRNKGSKGLTKFVEQYFRLNNIQFDYPRLTAKIVREGKFSPKDLHSTTNKMIEDCNSSKIHKIDIVVKNNPYAKKLNASNFATRVTDVKEVDFYECKNITELKNHIIGQDEAVKKVGDRIISSYIGFGSDKNPLATFLLTGPTGVGKTETAKAVAQLCTNGNIFTVDMATFKSDADISRLLGGSPNYVGYGDKNEFCEFIIEHPNCVILFDEIDKAHKGCLDLLMRMLDEGEFINAKGEVISLKNTIIFCTTNLTEYILDSSEKAVEERLTSQSGLRKELVGRFNEVIEYKRLDKDACRQIAKSILDNKILRFEKNNTYNLKLTYDNGLIDKIVDRANTDLFGARDLQRAIQVDFVDVVSNFVIQSGMRDTTIHVSSNGINKPNKTMLNQNQKTK